MEGITAKQRAQWSAHDDRVAKLLSRMKEQFPKLRIVFKDDSCIYQFFNLFIPDKMLYRMSTALFNAIAMSSRKKAEKNQQWYFEILSHEFVHLFQFRRAFELILTYLAPQIWLLLTLGLITTQVWLFDYVKWFQVLFTAGCTLVTFAPWPSPWRLQAELNAYAMNIAVRHWRRSVKSDQVIWTEQVDHDYINRRVEVMSGWRYWKMAWRRHRVRQFFDQRIQLIYTCPHRLRELSPAYDIVHQVLKGEPIADPDHLDENAVVGQFFGEDVHLSCSANGLYIVKGEHDA
jgi:hypothetical protein